MRKREMGEMVSERERERERQPGGTEWFTAEMLRLLAFLSVSPLPSFTGTDGDGIGSADSLCPPASFWVKHC